MSDNRKIKTLEYKAKPGEVIYDFLNFLVAKFENNKVEKVVGFHNYRKITIEELENE